jgi:hypothetical protein
LLQNAPLTGDPHLLQKLAMVLPLRRRPVADPNAATPPRSRFESI